jgi:hypothetical protein
MLQKKQIVIGEDFFGKKSIPLFPDILNKRHSGHAKFAGQISKSI